MMPLNNTNVSVIDNTVNAFVTSGFGSDLESDVKSAFKLKIHNILYNYQQMGYNIIGFWEYDTETEQYNLTGLANLTDNKLTKYYPYLKVLNAEFSSVTGREETHEQYQNANSVSESGSNNKTKTKIDDFSNSTHGTNRSAHEESPISSAPITSAPTESSTWNLDNPTSKNGEQFDNATTSHNASNIMEGENSSNAQMGNSSGNKTAYSDIPEELLKVLRFNVEQLNLSNICYLIVNSLIEEKVTIY